MNGPVTTQVFGQRQMVDTLTPDQLTRAVQSRVTPLSEYFNAVTYDAFQHSLPGVAYENIRVPEDDREQEYLGLGVRSGQLRYRRTDVPLMSEDDWKASEFYREGIPFDGRMTEARARAKAQIFDEDQERAWLRANTPWSAAQVGLAVAGSVIGTLPDPTNYIGFMGPAFKAANITRVNLMMARAGIGAIENMAATAVVDPIVATSRRQFGEDIGFADQLIDVAIAGLLGAGFGAVGGRFEKLPHVERFEDRAPTKVAGALQTVSMAADQIANDMPLDIAGPFRRTLLEGTSLGGTERVGRLTPETLARQATGPDAVIRGWEVKVSEAARSADPEAWAQRDTLLARQAELREQIDASKTDPRAPLDDLDAKIAYARDQLLNAPYAQKKQHQKVLNQLYAERDAKARPVLTGEQSPETLNARQALQQVDFQLRDLAPRISATLRDAQTALPRPASQAEAFEQMVKDAPGPTPFDRVMQETAPDIQDKVPVPRSNDVVWQPRPINSPETIARADAAVGKPEKLTDKGFQAKAAEHGLNETGEFEELADLRAVNENLTKAEQNDLADADATVKRADDYAKAYQAAASCLMKAAE